MIRSSFVESSDEETEENMEERVSEERNSFREWRNAWGTETDEAETIWEGDKTTSENWKGLILQISNC